MAELIGKSVVVTGAASGIGAATVARAVRFGAHVHAVDAAPAADRAVSADGGDGGDEGAVTYWPMDVTDTNGWQRLHGEIASSGGSVDGLVACAGITWRARVGDIALEDLTRVYAVNVGGQLLALQALLPLMPSGASVVLVGSLAGTNGHYPAAYTASKWAVRGLARSASMELGPRGVRVNAIHPGYIETPMTASAPDSLRTSSIDATPLGRAGTPEEVAAVAVFLLTGAASFVSGAEIAVDGGAGAHGGAKSVSDAMRAESIERTET